jgi:integrase/recombinase XerC
LRRRRKKEERPRWRAKRPGHNDVGRTLRARPHDFRHSSITRVLDLSGGDIRAAQRFSRHRDVRALERYDDSSEDMAGQLARRLAEEAG